MPEESVESEDIDSGGWQSLPVDRPWFGHGTVFSDPGTGQPLFADPEDLWELDRGGHWRRRDSPRPAFEGVEWATAWATPRGTFIGWFSLSHLVVVAIDDPARTETLPLPQTLSRGASPLPFVHHGVSYFHFGDETFAIRDGAVTLVADGPFVGDLAYDVEQGKAVGSAGALNQLHAFDGGVWRPLGRTKATPHGLAWDPARRAIVTMVDDGRGGLLLHRVSGTQLVPVTPNVRVPKQIHCGVLGVGLDGTIVYSGGDGPRHSNSNETFVKRAAQSSMLSDLRGDLAGAQSFDAVVTTTERVLVAGLKTGEVLTPTDSGWQVAHRAYGPERWVSVSAWDSRVFWLDLTGTLWESNEAAAPHRCGGEGAPWGYETIEEVALGYDASSERVIAFGGSDRNDTRAFDFARGRWEELRPGNPPPVGAASVVSTPAGIYALMKTELWRFAQAQWCCVGTDVPGQRLAYDPRRDRLLTLGWDRRPGFEARIMEERPGLWLWSKDGQHRHLAPLPDGASFAFWGHPGAVAGVDPVSDRVWLLESGVQWLPEHSRLPSSAAFSLELRTFEIQAAELPQSEVRPTIQRAGAAPPEWTRPAIGVRCSTRALSEPPALGVEVPGQLLGVVRASPPALELPEGYVAIALSEIPGWEPDRDRPDQPERPGDSRYRATLVPAPFEAPSFVMDEGIAYPLELSDPFSDVDPAHVHEIDTPPGNAEHLEYISKLGGYPQFVHGDLSERWEDPKPRFVLQLFDELPAVAGWAALYVYVSDEPARAYVEIEVG